MTFDNVSTLRALGIPTKDAELLTVETNAGDDIAAEARKLIEEINKIQQRELELNCKLETLKEEAQALIKEMR